MQLIKLIPVSHAIKDQEATITLVSPTEVEVAILSIVSCTTGKSTMTTPLSEFKITADVFFTALRMAALWRHGVEVTTKIDCGTYTVDFSIRSDDDGLIFRVVEIKDKKVTRTINFFIDHPISRMSGRDVAIATNLLEQWNNYTTSLQWPRTHIFN